MAVPAVLKKIRSPEPLLRVPSFAKVNLFLEILNRRPDGYHTLSTLFQEISLADEISVRLKGPSSQGQGVSLRCAGADLSTGPENLVVRAAGAFQERFPGAGPYAIDLTKRIPVGAGLGGGSSNAAAALKACWALHTGKPLKQFPWKSYVKDARRLGADVPFFLQGGMAAATGIGHLLKPLPDPDPFWLVLLFPRVFVSTKWVYQHLRFPLTKRRLNHRIKMYIGRHRPVQEWAFLLYNRLEEVVLPRISAVAHAKKALTQAGCLAALMSGSGSSVFGVVDSEQAGKRVVERLRSGAWDLWLVRTVLRDESTEWMKDPVL